MNVLGKSIIQKRRSVNASSRRPRWVVPSPSLLPSHRLKRRLLSTAKLIRLPSSPRVHSAGVTYWSSIVRTRRFGGNLCCWSVSSSDGNSGHMSQSSNKVMLTLVRLIIKLWLVVLKLVRLTKLWLGSECPCHCVTL